jgi:hypothetical protein
VGVRRPVASLRWLKSLWVEAKTICSNPSVNPAFERFLQIAHGISGLPAGQTATIVTDDDQAAHKSESAPGTQKQVQTRLVPSEAEQLCLDYQAGGTLKQLASQYRIHPMTVSAILERAGIARRSFNTGPSDDAIALAIKLYGEGYSTVAIGDAAGRSPETVRAHLLKNGIQVRSRRGWK